MTPSCHAPRARALGLERHQTSRANAPHRRRPAAWGRGRAASAGFSSRWAFACGAVEHLRDARPASRPSLRPSSDPYSRLIQARTLTKNHEGRSRTDDTTSGEHHPGGASGPDHRRLAGAIARLVLPAASTGLLAVFLEVSLVLAGLDLVITGALGHCPLQGNSATTLRPYGTTHDPRRRGTRDPSRGRRTPSGRALPYPSITARAGRWLPSTAGTAAG